MESEGSQPWSQEPATGPYPKPEESSRFWRVLTMVYNTQDYWVFWTFPASGILETRKHDVSETGSVFVFMWRGRRRKLSWAP
jgi:hypothetical protein